VIESDDGTIGGRAVGLKGRVTMPAAKAAGRARGGAAEGEPTTR
jgi:hypothetical protein